MTPSRSNSRIGYTDRQAETLHRRIERAVAKATDALAALNGLVDDMDVAGEVWTLQERVLEIQATLDATVDRRRRR